MADSSIDTAASPASPTPSGSPDSALDAELAGLDALETAAGPTVGFGVKLWSATWPKLLAIAIGLGLWQLIVVLQLKPEYVLPGPSTVFSTLWTNITDGTVFPAVGNTMQRAVIGFSMALVIGVAIGALVSRIRPLRVGVGSLLTGLQTMPSIAWFPFAILLFKISESAILFVIVIGAAPAIANGLISGTDQVPPLLVRAGKVLGAKGMGLYWNVVLRASLPTFIGGLKQGWAFAWRSLLAGELLVIIENKPSLGVQLSLGREFADAPWLISTMIVILVIGIFVDAGFGAIERGMLRRRGLLVS